MKRKNDAQETTEWPRKTSKSAKILQKSFVLACRNGDLETVRHCIQEGIDINQCDSGNRFGIFEACAKGELNIVKELILHNVDLFETQTSLVHSAWTALHIAAYFNHVPVINELIASNKINLEQKAGCGATAFHLAARSHSLEAMQTLISAKADVLCVDNKGRNALYAACQVNSRHVVHELLKHEAILKELANEPVNKRYSPLVVSCKKRYVNVVMQLVDKVPMHVVIRCLKINPGYEIDQLLLKRVQIYYHSIFKWLLFGQNQPESLLSVLHKYLLQDISKIIKEKIFL